VVHYEKIEDAKGVIRSQNSGIIILFLIRILIHALNYVFDLWQNSWALQHNNVLHWIPPFDSETDT